MQRGKPDSNDGTVREVVPAGNDTSKYFSEFKLQDAFKSDHFETARIAEEKKHLVQETIISASPIRVVVKQSTPTRTPHKSLESHSSKGELSEISTQCRTTKRPTEATATLKASK